MIPNLMFRDHSKIGIDRDKDLNSKYTVLLRAQLRKNKLQNIGKKPKS